MSDGNPAQLCLYVYIVIQEHLASNNWIIFLSMLSFVFSLFALFQRALGNNLDLNTCTLF